jgi:hypothetical protein
MGYTWLPSEAEKPDLTTAPSQSREPQSAGSVAVRNEILRALAIVFGATLALAVVQRTLPFTAPYMQVGLALILLQAPSWVYSRDLAKQAALGMRFGPWLRETKTALITMAVVFPIFVGGYHLLQTEILDHRAVWSTDQLARWDESLEYAPNDVCAHAAEGRASSWLQGSSIWLVAPSRGALTVQVKSDPPIRQGREITCLPNGPRVSDAVVASDQGVFSLGEGQGIWVSLGQRTDFALDVRHNGTPLAADLLRLGAGASTPDSAGGFASERSHWWLLTFVLVHLGLVAFPEEWFFRGYLMSRLDQWSPPRVRLLGVKVGWGLVLSALAFALLHPILLPGAHRLLVFFPALLFGWLRAKTGNVGAAILVHAGANVLQAVVSRMYI